MTERVANFLAFVAMALSATFAHYGMNSFAIMEFGGAMFFLADSTEKAIIRKLATPRGGE